MPLAYIVNISLAFVKMSSSAQTTQVFIPGKNWILSLAELVSFLEAKRAKFSIRSLSKEFFAVSIEEIAGVLTIADLGGILKIGNATTEFATQGIREAFLQKDNQARDELNKAIVPNNLINEMFAATPEKVFFGVSVYCAEESLRPVSKIIQRFLGSSVKRELSTHGKKSRFMGFSRDREYPQLSPVEVLKKHLVESKTEILLCIGRKQTMVANTVAVHNPFEFQKRDVGKPNQRKIFAMPPRLARIMVNLASCTQGRLLLDPFCGVGTILQEALLAELKVIGVDLNPWCIKAAEENLEWLKREYSLEKAEYTIFQGDARRLSDKLIERVDAIATEPDLGPALRQVPTTPYAKKIIAKLKPLYAGLLEAAYRVLKKDGRLVLVTPHIRTRSGGPVTMPIGEEAASIGFEIVYPFQKKIFASDVEVKKKLAETASFVDAEMRHKIGREIHVFQKIGK